MSDARSRSGQLSCFHCACRRRPPKGNFAHRGDEFRAVRVAPDVEECLRYCGRWGLQVLVRLHVVRVHVESVGEEILQLPRAPKSVLNRGEGGLRMRKR